jgi:hypothetical protein
MFTPKLTTIAASPILLATLDAAGQRPVPQPTNPPQLPVPSTPHQGPPLRSPSQGPKPTPPPQGPQPGRPPQGPRPHHPPPRPRPSRPPWTIYPAFPSWGPTQPRSPEGRRRSSLAGNCSPFSWEPPRWMQGRTTTRSTFAGKEPFPAIQLHLSGGSIKLYHLTVWYSDATSEQISVGTLIFSRSISSLIWLTGNRAVIESVDMWYERAPSRSYPTVRLYGSW